VLAITVFVVLTATFLLQAGNVAADQAVIRRQDLELNAGDMLFVHSDRSSIQRILLEGDLASANFTKIAEYPTADFEFAASKEGLYQLRMFFDYPSDYVVNLLVRDKIDGTTSNSTTYYVSAGTFELDIYAHFSSVPDGARITAPSVSPWDSFAHWMSRFGEAFPFWVKVLYLGLGLQFFAVGGLWIRRESARRDSGTQRLDAGNKSFLWLDLIYKYLLVCFVAILAIMGGELLVLFILRFMFLVSLDLLSLWDLFVVGFAAGAVMMVYLVRLTLEKIFDLKPIEDE